jgi:hypothetical protein
MRFGGVMLVVALAVGCAASPDPGAGEPPPSSGGLNPPSSVPPGPNGQCNALGAPGATITDQLSTMRPSLGGGTMADGNYVLNRYEWYSPNILHTRSIILVVSGGGTVGQYLWTRDQDPEQRVNVNIATSGAQIAMRATCPVGADLEWDQYGMTDSGLTLFSTRDNKAAFFARQ